MMKLPKEDTNFVKTETPRVVREFNIKPREAGSFKPVSFAAPKAPKAPSLNDYLNSKKMKGF